MLLGADEGLVGPRVPWLVVAGSLRTLEYEGEFRRGESTERLYLRPIKRWSHIDLGFLDTAALCSSLRKSI